jgi:hypothetical protein
VRNWAPDSPISLQGGGYQTITIYLTSESMPGLAACSGAEELSSTMKQRGPARAGFQLDLQ